MESRLTSNAWGCHEHSDGREQTADPLPCRTLDSRAPRQGLYVPFPWPWATIVIRPQQSFALGAYWFCCTAGCTLGGGRPPDSPVENSEQLFAADFDGDGSAEIVAVQEGTIYWGNHTYIYKGGIQAFVAGDLDGDGREELVLGMGRSRTEPKATPSLLVLDSQGAKVHSLGMPKHRITDLQMGAKGLYLTVLGRDKVALGGWWGTDGFKPRSKGTMALTQAPLPNGQTALGCLYGEEPRSHGGLFVQSADGTVVQLPSLRGVRSLETADVNGDGHLDLITGDGWHYRYGADALARLNLYLGPAFTDHRVIGDIPGNYTINQINPIQVDGRGPLEILAVGTANLVLFSSDSVGWSQSPMGASTEQMRVSVGRTKGLAWVGIPGKPTKVGQIPSP